MSDSVTLLLGQQTQLPAKTDLAKKKPQLLLLDILQLSLELSALKLHLFPLQLCKMKITTVTLLNTLTTRCGH